MPSFRRYFVTRLLGRARSSPCRPPWGSIFRRSPGGLCRAASARQGAHAASPPPLCSSVRVEERPEPGGWRGAGLWGRRPRPSGWGRSGGRRCVRVRAAVAVGLARARREWRPVSRPQGSAGGRRWHRGGTQRSSAEVGAAGRDWVRLPRQESAERPCPLSLPAVPPCRPTVVQEGKPEVWGKWNSKVVRVSANSVFLAVFRSVFDEGIIVFKGN